MTELLSARRLNRATLARQYLLERRYLLAGSVVAVIEQLAGMQAQAPLAPYVGLWTRIQDFAAGELATLTETRQVVRLHLMRNTVHLVSARDCLDWRLLFAPLHAAAFRGHFGVGINRAGIDEVDLAALASYAAELLEGGPLSRGELGAKLAARWPSADPATLAFAATHHLALCQVPPRGIWGRHGPAVWTPVQSWLGAELRTVPVDALVLRYLAAFGPASVADAQMWSGLTRLREVVERLPLRTFRTADGQSLYDLPDAPRPPEDTPAPPRFLPEYDNLLLSYKDRTRVLCPQDRAAGRPVPLPPGNGAAGGTFLVDGLWHGTWRFRDGNVHVEPFSTLAPKDHEALQAEAERLREFLRAQPRQ